MDFGSSPVVLPELSLPRLGISGIDDLEAPGPAGRLYATRESSRMRRKSRAW